MLRRINVLRGCQWTGLLLAALGLAAYAGCEGVPGPVLVNGPAVVGNQTPAIEITDPIANFAIGQGATFGITWTDQDRDSAARIAFSLINTDPEASPASVSLVEGIPENDTAAADAVTVTTAFVPRGSYYLQGTITDGVNTPVTTFATTAAPGNTRIIITVGEEGSTPSNQPPIIFVSEPLHNLSVTLDDIITIEVQPSPAPPNANTPYDADDETLLYISLDLDDDPKTGDPLAPDPDELIALLDTPITIPEGTTDALEPIPISVDLTRFPLREDGKSYFIRATIDDGTNEPRDAYATGTINVTRAATGKIDLGLVGGVLTGATWLGFDPGARLGTAMTTVTDFDADGIGDCVLVDELGTPSGRFPLGEAYLVYGLDGRRFGGRINVNQVGTNVDGATFLGPEPQESEETLGISSAGYIPDLSGDGRPELLFGAPFADGIRQHRDDDPSDRDVGDPEQQREEVRVKIRQGNLEVVPLDPFGVEDETPEFITQAYNGVIDTVLDRNDPNNTSLAGAATLTWDGAEVNDQFAPTQWIVIQFDIVDLSVPDFFQLSQDDIGIVDATLFLNIIGRGDDANVHALLQPITSTTTFATFSAPDDDGELLPLEDVHYAADAVDGNAFEDVFTGENGVDVTDTIEDIFDNRQDIYGWIIIPTDLQGAVVDSSEADFAFRPRLEITYSRPVPGSGFSLDGCYPDLMPNNTSNRPQGPGNEDDMITGLRNFESLGMVAMVHSENRDTDFLLSGDEFELSQNRLRGATAPLDLAGQQPTTDSGGTHFSPAQGVAVGDFPARTEGARFQVCMYDIVDDRQLAQPPVRAEFGKRVAFSPDIDNDQRPEIVISAPRNELDIQELKERYPNLADTCPEQTGLQPDRDCEIPHLVSRPHWGNIIIYQGLNFNTLREKNSGLTNSTWPHFNRTIPQGSCTDPVRERLLDSGVEYEFTVISGEKPDDLLGDATSAGDFNLDGSPDILCGAQFADRPNTTDAGTTYIVYMRQDNEDQGIKLANANNPARRPPMIRIRGDRPDDRIGWAQESVLDINGDRINDIVLASPFADAGGVTSDERSRDFNGSGSEVPDGQDNAQFSACRAQFGDADLSTDDDCAFFDYNNDRRVDATDADVFAGGDFPVDNGVVAVVFGGIPLDGDRLVKQIATTDLPGVKFFGGEAGDRAGHDVASAGDFNRDGFGDLLITAPGATGADDNERVRVGLVYLIFGGPHLNNRDFSLDDVGTADLPGLVFMSPFEAGAPNEAPPQFVAGLGDLNNDGFADIGIGNPLADFVDTTLPQQPGSPGDDLTTGRRRDAGEIYLVYGHNISD